MRRISDKVRQKIRTDRECIGLTLYKLAEKYGLSKSTIYEIIKDCDDTKVVKACPSRKRVKKVVVSKRPDLSTTDLGEAARQMICARLMLNGIDVFRPMTEDTSIDLLILKKDSEVLRAQCKYIFPAKNGLHVLQCTSSGRGSNRGKVRHVYGSDEVDVFLGYCLDNDGVYVVPRDVIGERRAVTMWILREPVGVNNKEIFEADKFKGAFDLLK